MTEFTVVARYDYGETSRYHGFMEYADAKEFADSITGATCTIYRKITTIDIMPY